MATLRETWLLALDKALEHHMHDLGGDADKIIDTARKFHRVITGQLADTNKEE